MTPMPQTRDAADYVELGMRGFLWAVMILAPIFLVLILFGIIDAS